jgi:hypothetical protein
MLPGELTKVEPIARQYSREEYDMCIADENPQLAGGCYT